MAVFAGGLADRFGNVNVVAAAIVHWPIKEQPVLRLTVQNTQQ